MLKKLLIIFGIFMSVANAELSLENKKILTVYYSWGGNTKDVATKIQAEVGGDIFELVQEKPYPSEYKETIKVAKSDVESDFKPTLKNKPENVGNYDIIFLGSPVWWGTIAPAVKTFLSENNLEGKVVIPFVSHGGGGRGNSEAAVKKFAPKTNIYKMESFYGKTSQKEVKKWINNLKKK
jgi:flavodoxin